MASIALWTLLVAYRNMLFSTHSIIYHIYYNIFGSQKSLGKLTFSFQEHFCTEQVIQHSDIPILNEKCL